MLTVYINYNIYHSLQIHKAYHNFMMTIARQLGAATAYDSKSFADQVYHFEARLAEVHPSARELREPFLGDNPGNVLKMRIRELNLKSPAIRWVNLLQKMFPNSQISENSNVLVVHPDYFYQLSNIISSATDE